MPQQRIEYPKLVEQALRGVVRETLRLVARDGLPGRHHLFITFRTDHPGVEIADVLRARYPAEMTVVLQHEYWDLEVDETGFAVGLSFNEVPHRLRVPFEAIAVFADPSVEFGLQFTMPEQAPTETRPVPGPKAVPRAPAPVAELPRPAGSSKKKDGGAQVVTLDRFRKK